MKKIKTTSEDSKQFNDGSSHQEDATKSVSNSSSTNLYRQLSDIIQQDIEEIDHEMDDTADFEDEDIDFETEVPIDSIHRPVLLMLYETPRYKKKSNNVDTDVVPVDNLAKVLDLSLKIPLDVTVSISSISAINEIEESFRCNLRLFAMWQVNLDNIGLGILAAKAKKNGQFCHMSLDEIIELKKSTVLPSFTIMNGTDIHPLDMAEIRVYCGDSDNTFLLWNQGFGVSCKLNMQFDNFPYDEQHLPIELMFDTFDAYQLYNMRLTVVQFHKQALYHSEWIMLSPFIQPYTVLRKHSTVYINLQRRAAHYLYNVVSLLVGLMIINLLIYALDFHEAGYRLLGIFTNILNFIAFKLYYSTIIPKVSYDTLINSFFIDNFLVLIITSFLSIVPTFIEDPDQSKQINLMMLLISIGLFVTSLTLWTVRVIRTVSRTRKKYESSPIQVKEHQNWYSFSFQEVDYLPKPSDMIL